MSFRIAFVLGLLAMVGCGNPVGGSCIENLPCSAGTCKAGKTICVNGSAVCAPTGNSPDGSPCGSGSTCESGVCTSTCNAGKTCSLSYDLCSLGTISCFSGNTPECIPSFLHAADGVPCGDNQFCLGGTCSSCVQGTPCGDFGGGCGVGKLDCVTGQCMFDHALADGTSCGIGQVCSSGDCVTCNQGATCTPANACMNGTLDCTTGKGVCKESFVKVNGTSCGTGQVCEQGQCTTCSPGAACASPDPCRASGAISCDSGAPVCFATSQFAPDGTSCGTNLYCRSGSCSFECVPGAACTYDGCNTGEISCTGGVSTCVPTAKKPNGTDCGTSWFPEVCHEGVCGACTAGNTCASATVCHDAQTSCATGVSQCVDSGNTAAGTSCNSGKGVCNGQGSCVACVAGTDCGTTCAPAKIVCTSGAPVCTPTNTNTNEFACGTNGKCELGVCEPLHVLSVVSGDGQAGIISTAVLQPLVFRLTDGASGAPIAGASVLCDVQTQVTDADGKVSFSGGLYSDDPQSFLVRAVEQAKYPALDASAYVTLKALAPSTGTILSIVDASHQAGGLAPGVTHTRAVTALVGAPKALAVNSQQLFFSDGCRIFADWGGTLYFIAGGDCGPSTGEGAGQTRSVARFSEIRGLAVDYPNQLLYVAEPDRIRVSTISTITATNPFTIYAGGPNPPIPGDGDGGLATNAVLSDVRDVVMGPDGAVYVSANGRIRRIDKTAKTIAPWYTPATPDCTQPTAVASCLGGGCRVTWDAQKRPWMTANLCGTEVGGTARGVVLLDGGDFVRIAGTAAQAVGANARLAFDSASSSILFTDPTAQKIQRIDTLTHAITTVAGTGGAGDFGDLGPATSALLRDPSAAVMFKGHLTIADTNNHTIRLVW